MLADESLRHILGEWLDWSRRLADTVPRALIDHCVLTPEFVTPSDVRFL